MDNRAANNNRTNALRQINKIWDKHFSYEQDISYSQTTKMFAELVNAPLKYVHVECIVFIQSRK